MPLEGMAPNSEVTAKAKQRILREADALSEIGGISEWPRRESRCGETAHRDLAGGNRCSYRDGCFDCNFITEDLSSEQTQRPRSWANSGLS